MSMRRLLVLKLLTDVIFKRILKLKNEISRYRFRILISIKKLIHCGGQKVKRQFRATLNGREEISN